MGIEICTRTKEGAIVVTNLKGSVNVESFLTLKNHFSELLAKGQNRLAVNFKGVDYVDSSGVDLLISVYKQVAATNHGKFCFFGVPANVMEVFEYAGLDSKVVIVDKEDMLPSVF